MPQSAQRAEVRWVAEWPAPAQYALSIGLVLVALGIRWLLDPLLGEQLAYATVFFAMLALAVLVRPGPLLAGGVIGLLGVVFLFLHPRLAFGIAARHAQVQTGLYALGTALGVLASSQLHQARDRQRRADAELRLLVDALRGNEERMQLALAAGKGATWDLDLTTDRNLRSGTHYTVLGYDTDPARVATPPTWRDTVVAEDLPLIEAEWSRAERERDVYRAEPRLRAADGRIHWARAAGRFLYDETGKAVRFVGVWFDVSDEKQAHQRLEQVNERLRQALEELESTYAQSPVGMCQLDRDLRIVRVNERLAAMNGIPASQQVGKPLREVVPDLAPRLESEFRKAIETGKARLDVEITGRSPADSGATHTWLQSWFPLRDAEGRVIGLDVVVQDITERKRVEEALREADRRKDEFLATLAHELRNPLAPIRSGLSALAVTSDAATIDATRAMMERQVEQLVRLVDDLMDASRITRGRIELHRQRVEIAAIVHGAIETSQPLVEAGGYVLEVDVPSDPLVVDGDPVRLMQVVVNLLHNAVKYTEPGGRIRLAARREGARVALSVADSGTGIAPDALAKVFDLFAQADVGYARRRGGLGIGLTLARTLVERHDGTIEAHSEGPGRGSEFVVHLPLAEGAVAAEPTPARDVRSRGTLRRRILVVDDHREAAESLALLLSLRGATVFTANDGRAALDALGRHRPDAVLLDIGMPGMDGYEVARRMRARPDGRAVTLVALTGWGQPDDRKRSAEAGIDHHVVKPVAIDELERLLAPS